MDGEKGMIGGGDRQSWKDFDRRTTYDAAVGQAVEARLEELQNMPRQVSTEIKIDWGDVSFMPVASREQLPSLYAAIEQEYAADMNRMVDIRDPNGMEIEIDWDNVGVGAMKVAGLSQQILTSFHQDPRRAAAIAQDFAAEMANVVRNDGYLAMAEDPGVDGGEVDDIDTIAEAAGWPIGFSDEDIPDGENLESIIDADQGYQQASAAFEAQGNADLLDGIPVRDESVIAKMTHDLQEITPEELERAKEELDEETDRNYGGQPVEWEDGVSRATSLADAADQDVAAYLARFD